MNQIEKELVFKICGKDYEELLEFKKIHDPCFENHHDFTGAQYKYTFIPTGLGDYIDVECSCGEHKTLLNYYD